MTNSDKDKDDGTMGSNQDGKPLQLIRFEFEQRGDFEESLKATLDTNVLDTILKTCKDRKLCVITVTGHAQSGKGLLLNVIKEVLMAAEKDIKLKTNWLDNKNISGFHHNNSYKPTTKGVWIWNRAFMIKGDDEDDEEIAVLLLETQGYHEEFTKPDEMLAILGISVLTSSVLVLNFSGDLPNMAFDWLETFCEFGIKLVGKGIQKPFQNLSFLIRDWTRLSEYSSYGASSGKKLFEKRSKVSGIVGKNLEKCFEEVDCFLMPHIGAQALIQSSKGNPVDMGRDFTRRLQTYVKGLCDPENLRIKKILDNALTAPEWKQLLSAYVALFNDKSETAWGLQAESIWWLTKETMGRIKIDQALAAYKQVYHQREGNCVGGYIRERSIGGVHVQAKGKSLEAFSELLMPEEEETYFKGKLQHRLEEEKKKILQENTRKRSSMIASLLSDALCKIRSGLEALLPFKSDDGSNVPSELIFYEDTPFHQAIHRTIDSIEQEFLENFQDDDVDEINKVKGTLSSVLQPIVEEYTDKNMKNRTRTINMARKETEKLKQDYKSEMNDFLHDPEITARTLRRLHEKQVKTVTANFKQLKIGSASFQQQCLENILDELEDEFEGMEGSLDSTYNKALEMAKLEETNYREMLKQKASALENADGQIQEYHQNACKAIMAKFATASPLRKNVNRKEQIERRLKSLLETTYVEIVEEGVVAKRNLEKKLKEVRDSAVEQYKENMKREIVEEGQGEFIYDDEDFKTKSSTYQQIATELCEEKLEDILNGNTKFFDIDDEMNKLDEELEAAAASEFKKNETLRINAETAADVIYKQCNEKFESKMVSAVSSKLKTREDLTKEFDQLLQQTLTEFENDCSSTNKKLRQSFIEMIKKKATAEIFSGVEEVFQMKMQRETVVVRTALVDVKKLYFEKMEGYFRNKSGPNYFAAEELQELHEQAKRMALRKTTDMDPPLNQSQLEDLSQYLEKYFEIFTNKNDLIWRSYDDTNTTIGIDLGTTYLCVGAYFQGKVVILRNSIGENTTPSYVTINSEDDGSIICGSAAKENCFENPEKTIYAAKRIIGRPMNDKMLQEDMKYWPFTVVEESGAPKIEVAGHTYYPEEISAMLLKHLKEEAEENLGVTITKAVITVPAYFTDAQRKATLRAGEIAGLEVLGLLKEPIAAALAYKIDWFHSDEPRNILVFDLGGGTFDVVVLEMKDDEINVLSTGGNDHLGGEDFDKKLMEYCAGVFKDNTGIDLFDGKDSPDKGVRDEAKQRLRRLQLSCEAAKKKLTNPRSKTSVSIAKFVGNQDLIVEVKMEEFEKQNAEFFRETIDIVDDTLKSARLAKDDVDEIVLVGGSTRIPKVQQMLKEYFNNTKVLNKKINPDEAVAFGAAVQAAMLSANPGSRVFGFATVQDVTPMSLGIEEATKILDVIIPKNTAFPTEKTRVYRTYSDNQPTAQIKIYQGEHLELAAANKLLGEFTLSGIPPAKAGKQALDVTMKIDANGILSVEASCQSTGNKKSITISDDRGGMTEEEKKLLMRNMASACLVHGSHVSRR